MQGLLKLLNVETGVEQLTLEEFGLTWLLVLFLTEDPEKSGANDSD